MSMIQDKEAALLGLLAESSMHPYQIEKIVEQRDMRSWTDISMSTIYKTLRNLETKGYVQKDVKINEKNVAQKNYIITELGLDVLREKLFELISVVEPKKWRIDIGLNNLNLLEPQKAVELLQKYILELIQCNINYKSLEKYLKESKCPSYVQAVAVRPQYLIKADIEWANEFINNINGLEEEWD